MSDPPLSSESSRFKARTDRKVPSLIGPGRHGGRAAERAPSCPIHIESFEFVTSPGVNVFPVRAFAALLCRGVANAAQPALTLPGVRATWNPMSTLKAI